jgi:hypothetical protein
MGEDRAGKLVSDAITPTVPKVERLKDGSGFYRTRISFGGAQRRIKIHLTDESAAIERAAALAALGALIRDGQVDKDIGEKLLDKAGAAPTDAAFVQVSSQIRKVVSSLATGEIRRAPKPAASTTAGSTIRQLGEAWTSGELARKFPDHVKAKRESSHDESHLEFLCKTIGDIRIEHFKLEDAERAMASLPEGLSSATRRHYAQTISKLLKLAGYPLRLISQTPLPEGWLPKVKQSKATAYLYPSEDTALLTCEAVPLARRMLYGFLVRASLFARVVVSARRYRCVGLT